MKIRIGQNEIKSTSFENLPAGNYNVSVSEFKEDTWKSGKKYVAVQYTVLDGEYKGRKITDNLTFSPENIMDPEKFSRQNFKMTQYADHFLNEGQIGEEIDLDFGADAFGSWSTFANMLRNSLYGMEGITIKVTIQPGKKEVVPALDAMGLPIAGQTQEIQRPDNVNIGIVAPKAPTTV